jgi:hypothetical protein
MEPIEERVWRHVYAKCLQELLPSLCDEYMMCWYRPGTSILDRRGGPAKVLAFYESEWYRNGQRHRDYGPAIMMVDGSEECGQVHRDHGPAVSYLIGGLRAWFQRGQCHRTTGPLDHWTSTDTFWTRFRS